MSDLRISSLRCEYAARPLGIDVLRPRLYWQFESGRRGARQTAYRIRVSSQEGGPADLWDSGKVAADRSTQIEYEGKPLNSRMRAYWNVEAWDEFAQSTGVSASAWWEMGLTAADDWQAKWIGADLAGGPKTSVPCPLLRREFTIEKPVRSARLYCTALGVYVVYLNGRRASLDELAPGWTDFRKRIRYQACDVTDLMVQGENALGTMLGDGWACGFLGMRDRQLYSDRPKLFAQLEITYEDGTRKVIATDENWKFAFGPILEADLIMGESQDARLGFEGWQEAGFDDSRWRTASVFRAPEGQLEAMESPGIREIELIRPIELTEHPQSGSRWIFDLGQNMVGRVRIKLRGSAGQTITLRHSEILNTDGTPYYTNLRSAKQTDHYTFNGGGEEVFEPLFTFHGFRYVEVEGLMEKPALDSLVGVVLHSCLEATGDFECSEPLINQLQHNIQWGQKGNFLDVPTDCPQRDERLGWTGDAQVFARTAAYNLDVQGFFEKYQKDLEDAQSPEGSIALVVPSTDIGTDGGPAWADAIVICPWTMYLCYGDKRILERHYSSMKRFLDFELGTSKGFIRCYPGYEGFSGFGDWLSINADTPSEVIGTAFFAYAASLMAKIAGAIGEEGDACRYSALREDIKAAFIRRFVTPEGYVHGNTQTGYVLALHFDLLPSELRSAATEALVADIRRRGNQLSTGFVGAPYLAHVLSANGRADVAYDLLNQKKWPSWLYAVTHGATTIWERWDGWTHDRGFQDPGMNSFNHYAYGSVGDWMYPTIGGIELDPANPGYKHVVLKPQPGGGLTWAKAGYRSVHGQIKSEWEIQNGVFRWRIVLPPNTSGTAFVKAADGANVLEGGKPVGESTGVTPRGRVDGFEVYDIDSGEYRFEALH